MQHHLHSLFHPQTIAVIGASDRYGSMGRAVFGHLLAHQSAPHIVPVNVQHKTISGMKAYESVTEAAQEHTIDTVIVVLSADKTGAIVREVAKLNIENIIIINELEQISAPIRSKLERVAEQAKKLGVRVLAMPMSGLYGLFHRQDAACAYIGQSAGIADCMLSYAQSRGIAFSRFLTINPQNYPISTGQMIDYLLTENGTSAILVHISTLDNARELLSALTAAARIKSVFVLSTLVDEKEENLLKQALERRKIFTVSTLTEFLTVAKLLHTGVGVRGKRISVLSNTPQIAALILKTLPQTGLQLAQNSSTTVKALGKLLPFKPITTNPLYLPADTTPVIFQAAAEWCLQDEQADALCVIYAGTNAADSHRVAQMTGALQQRYPNKPLLLAWLGSADNEEIRKLFNKNKNLHFRQPEHALHALVQLNHYRDHQQQRHETSSFYDYRAAMAAAHILREQLVPPVAPSPAPSKTNAAHLRNALDELQKHLRPLLPTAVLPTSKTVIAQFLTALKVQNLVSKETHLTLQWARQADFGEVLTLFNHHARVQWLPPLTPEFASKILNQLDLPVAIWQDWLLDTVEILSRQPEMDCELVLHHDVKRGICCSDAKLNVHFTDEISGSLNVFEPYPFECEESILLKNQQKAFIRPIRHEDADLIRQIVQNMSENSRQMRFMSQSADLPPSLLSRLSRPDYQREFAILVHDEQHRPLAMANYTADNNMQSCEFGINLIDEMQGQGLGVVLMERLIQHARAHHFSQMRAEILASNHPMQKLALKLGFTLSQNPHDASMVNAVLPLN